MSKKIKHIEVSEETHKKIKKMSVEDGVTMREKMYTLSNTEPISAVYHLMYDDDVVYVGQSVDVCNRIQQHLYGKIKKFNNFRFFPLDKDKLIDKEREDIEEYLPKYNKSMNPNVCMGKEAKYIGIKIPKEDYEIIERAMLAKKKKHKKHKGYKIGSFMKECALNSAKRILK